MLQSLKCYYCIMDYTFENTMSGPETVRTNICRICLRKVVKTTYLYSKDILDRLHACFQLTLSFKKYLPSVICDDCIQELNIAYNFRQKCVTIEERYSILLQITDNNLDNDTVESVDIKEDISEKVEFENSNENKVLGNILICYFIKIIIAYKSLSKYFYFRKS